MVLIEGKDFSNLTPREVAEMIDVHLGGEGRFDRDALYEFRSFPNVEGLEAARQAVVGIDHQFATSSSSIDGIDTEGGKTALAQLAADLRSRGCFPG